MTSVQTAFWVVALVGVSQLGSHRRGIVGRLAERATGDPLGLYVHAEPQIVEIESLVGPRDPHLLGDLHHGVTLESGHGSV